MNASGNLSAGALTPGCDAETTGFAGAGLAAVDMGNEASIGLFGTLTRKTTGFELGIKVHGPTIRSRAERRTRREEENCFQNRYQRLRRLQPACVEFDDFCRLDCVAATGIGR